MLDPYTAPLAHTSPPSTDYPRGTRVRRGLADCTLHPGRTLPAHRLQLIPLVAPGGKTCGIGGGGGDLAMDGASVASGYEGYRLAKERELLGV